MDTYTIDLIVGMMPPTMLAELVTHIEYQVPTANNMRLHAAARSALVAIVGNLGAEQMIEQAQA